MIASHVFTNPTYTLFDKFGTQKAVFYLPDTYIETPAAGASYGVVLSQDNDTYKIFLSVNELAVMGFASISLFTTQFDADKLTTLSGGTSTSEIVNVLEEATVSGDGVTDDTAAIDAIIAANSNKILYFQKADYLAHITVAVDTMILGETGARVFWSSTTAAAITISSGVDVTISKMTFDSTNAAGTGIDNNADNSIIVDSHFRGFFNRLDGTLNTEIANYNNCIFEIHTAVSSDIGSTAWSTNSTFKNCVFTGTIGADVQDSTFYDCRFGDNLGASEWGVHMPLGTVDNAGAATLFSGDAKFYNCYFYAGDNALTDTYACGLGNAAHPEFYDCSFIGNLYGLYVRSESTVLCENCYFRAKMTTSGAVSLAFIKWNPGGWPVGVDGEGSSIIRGGKIISAVYSLLIPDSAVLGDVSLDGVSLEWNKLIVTDSLGAAQDHNNSFKYITDVVAFPDSLFQSIAVTAGDQVIAPPFTPSGTAFVELVNNAAGTRNVRLTKFYRNPDGFYKNGSILILRGTSDTNTCTVKNGYWAAETTLTVNASNEDVVLGNGDVAAYIYYTNTWHELTNFNLSDAINVTSSKQIELGADSKFKFTATSTIPSPATNVMYLDDGTNHGLGGVVTLMFHNGVGWNALH